MPGEDQIGVLEAFDIPSSEVAEEFTELGVYEFQLGQSVKVRVDFERSEGLESTLSADLEERQRCGHGWQDLVVAAIGMQKHLSSSRNAEMPDD